MRSSIPIEFKLKSNIFSIQSKLRIWIPYKTLSKLSKQNLTLSKSHNNDITVSILKKLIWQVNLVLSDKTADLRHPLQWIGSPPEISLKFFRINAPKYKLCCNIVKWSHPNSLQAITYQFSWLTLAHRRM